MVHDMNQKYSFRLSFFCRTTMILLSATFILGVLSCRQVIPPPPPVAIIPIPQETLSVPSKPPKEEIDPIARVVEDLPPPVPVLPPVIEAKKPPPPEPWKIVVKKTQRKLFLFQKGELQKIYPIDLGKNPRGPKIHQGDKRTPEGEYRVLEKRDRGQTQFYLAFLLNYPNEIDRTRYQMAVKNGLVPNDIGIGSLIEIHGEGMGFDWTKGCIALYNNHMQELFTQVPVGTPVLIEP